MNAFKLPGKQELFSVYRHNFTFHLLSTNRKLRVLSISVFIFTLDYSSYYQFHTKNTLRFFKWRTVLGFFKSISSISHLWQNVRFRTTKMSNGTWDRKGIFGVGISSLYLYTHKPGVFRTFPCRLSDTLWNFAGYILHDTSTHFFPTIGCLTYKRQSPKGPSHLKENKDLACFICPISCLPSSGQSSFRFELNFWVDWANTF